MSATQNSFATLSLHVFKDLYGVDAGKVQRGPQPTDVLRGSNANR